MYLDPGRAGWRATAAQGILVVPQQQNENIAVADRQSFASS